MQILVCIDDTDNIDSRGTGELAEMIMRELENRGWGKCSWVTRHQLLLDPTIPYTSHNSSMCFTADILQEHLQSVIDYASEFLKRESVAEADPGLCVVAITDLLDKQSLIDFGFKAKREVITKEEAYNLVERTHIHLSEHGGNGQGVIGALAGAGLRLSRNDGRLKGSLKINAPDNIITVHNLCLHPAIDEVRSLDEIQVGDNEIVLLGKLVKPLFINGKAVILVEKVLADDGQFLWKTCSKNQLSAYEEKRMYVVSK
ncbi:hypothetical protein SPSIL_041020 [Sporomusa silvacetica DSM 10669]|uniref:tRNA(Ile2) 2-agmatinylcytidine synthetase n=1 Tax=Sporomusa silvacetica DSM 10669 TaxID=1123289 RepID=A0ABZ3IQZ5_9FIRM|nr:hypothetical protein [Sporomusa silvacetica]OZC22866.1 hypothetical protein SPSIL_04390 [Sporomusa silvacetica DSM 10669]